MEFTGEKKKAAVNENGTFQLLRTGAAEVLVVFTKLIILLVRSVGISEAHS